jgi:two-component system chemotaxis response regulator CheB
MIRVLIAEDSVTVRELLQAVLSADPEIVIAGTAKNGLEAAEMTKRLRPDVVTMDINMPVMNGFEATKQIMIEMPTPIVIISASVDVREVGVSMAALNAGALALLEKPAGVGSPQFEESVRHLVSTVKAMAGVKVVRHWHQKPAPPQLPLLGDRPPRQRTRIVAIAASTGGPAALGRVLSDLPANFPVPILVVQHMARGFLEGLASWLNTTCSLKVKIAAAGDPLTSSTVLLAGDDRHLGVTADFLVKLDGSPPIGGFRPSANYMFASVGAVYGPSAIGLILTGMGQDGVEGLRQLRVSGGRVLAQDEESSVIFGMPRAAIDAGLADKIVPLPSIGKHLVSMIVT